MTPTLRAAALADIPAILEVGRSACADTYTALTPPGYVAYLLDSYWAPEAFARAIHSEQDHLLVAVGADGQVAGLVEVQEHDEHSASMWKLYVRRPARGQGVGRALVAAALDRLSPSVTTLWTEYLTRNTRAGRFYAAQGFVFDREEVETFAGEAIAYTYVKRPRAPRAAGPVFGGRE